jgi:hypothetical protein
MIPAKIKPYFSKIEKYRCNAESGRAERGGASPLCYNDAVGDTKGGGALSIRVNRYD